MRLVTVSRIWSSNSIEVLPLVSAYDLHFVPEPGTLFLLGSGIAGLVAFGRARR